MIPQRGKWSNNKKACGKKTGLTPPDLLWLALPRFLRGEGMEECLFICFVRPHFLRRYWNLSWKPCRLRAFASLTSSLLTTLCFRATPDSALTNQTAENRKATHKHCSGAWRSPLMLTSPGATSSESGRASGFCCSLLQICTFFFLSSESFLFFVHTRRSWR